MSDKPYQLVVVMPVYNEAEAIAPVLRKWCAMLDTLALRYRIRAYNDGSKDATGQILQREAEASGGRVLAIDKPNGGHGPTILQGYREATEEADWVFQIDSDDEMAPDSFPALWAKREDFDFLVGRRAGRRQPLARKVISFVSRACVRLFYGRGVWDVNAPYRLMRAAVFAPLYAAIPTNTFAPNVILSGLAARLKLRAFEMPVPQHDRTTGEVSIKKWKLLKAAARSLKQTFLFALHFSSLSSHQTPSPIPKSLKLILNFFSIAGFLFSISLILFSPIRLHILPLILLIICGLMLSVSTHNGRKTILWLLRHPTSSVVSIITLFILFRLLYLLLFNIDITAKQSFDFNLLWTQAQVLASGQWPINKSWMTVLFYGGVIKVFGVSLIAAYVATLLLKTLTLGILYRLTKQWTNTLGALIALTLMAFSLHDIDLTHHTATEHLFTFFLLLTTYALAQINKLKRSIPSCLWGILLGFLTWFTIWSRGEGVIFWILIPLFIILTYMHRELSRKVAIVLLLTFGMTTFVGGYMARTINQHTANSNTFFCSDDNLWPRLFGLNLSSNGSWTHDDHWLIWNRYLHDHPDANKGIDIETYKIPASIAGQCPHYIVPYVKAEISHRWKTMPCWQLLKLELIKIQRVWLKTYIPFHTNHPQRKYLYQHCFAITATTLALLSSIFFLICYLRSPLYICVTFWSGLVFVIGNAALLLLTEAGPRYNFSFYTFFPIYAATALQLLLPIGEKQGQL